MSRIVRVAAVQMRSGMQPEANMAALEEFVAEAAAKGARYVLTPEMTVAFAENREGLKAVSGPMDGNASVARAGEIAKKYGVFLHVGSMAIALPDGYFANRAILFTPQGEIAATYDKIHLFDATLPGINAYRESHTYRGGDKAVVADAAGFKLGFAICYDMRFPPLFNALAKGGAEVMAVPAAFTVPTGQAHWHALLRTRAIETGSFVISAAQGGTHENGRSTYGHSLVIDPWGKVIAEADGDAPGVVIADIDLDQITEVRNQVPALANARPFALP